MIYNRLSLPLSVSHLRSVAGSPSSTELMREFCTWLLSFILTFARFAPILAWSRTSIPSVAVWRHCILLALQLMDSADCIHTSAILSGTFTWESLFGHMFSVRRDIYLKIMQRWCCGKLSEELPICVCQCLSHLHVRFFQQCRRILFFHILATFHRWQSFVFFLNPSGRGLVPYYGYFFLIGGDVE